MGDLSDAAADVSAGLLSHKLEIKTCFGLTGCFSDCIEGRLSGSFTLLQLLGK